MEETPRPADRPATPARVLGLEEYDRLRELTTALRISIEVASKAEAAYFLPQSEGVEGYAAWLAALKEVTEADDRLRSFTFDLLTDEAVDEMRERRLKREAAEAEAARKADGPRADAEVKVLDPATYYTTPMAAAEPSGTWSGATRPAGLDLS